MMTEAPVMKPEMTAELRKLVSQPANGSISKSPNQSHKYACMYVCWVDCLAAPSLSARLMTGLLEAVSASHKRPARTKAEEADSGVEEACHEGDLHRESPHSAVQCVDAESLGHLLGKLQWQAVPMARRAFQRSAHLDCCMVVALLQ